MPGYLAMTNERWAGMLQTAGFTGGINFWSPSGKPLRNDIAGCQIYFFAKPPGRTSRHIVGFGVVRDFSVKSVSEAWSHFHDGNGARSLAIFLKLLNMDHLHSHGSRPLNESSSIACHTVDDIRWIGELDIKELGIHVRPGVQRGRTLTAAEEEAIGRACQSGA